MRKPENSRRTVAPPIKVSLVSTPAIREGLEKPVFVTAASFSTCYPPAIMWPNEIDAGSVVKDHLIYGRRGIAVSGFCCIADQKLHTRARYIGISIDRDNHRDADEALMRSILHGGERTICRAPTANTA
jgi:hypothetical protein